jgi:hypothetical protein
VAPFSGWLDKISSRKDYFIPKAPKHRPFVMVTWFHSIKKLFPAVEEANKFNLTEGFQFITELLHDFTAFIWPIQLLT